MFPSPGLMCHMDSIQPNPVAVHIAGAAESTARPAIYNMLETILSFWFKVSNNNVTSSDILVASVWPQKANRVETPY